MWSDLAAFAGPARIRLQSLDERAISRRRIKDPEAVYALRTLASGMHSGITSPARPWFKLQTQDRDLREWGPVKTWIDEVERLVREMFGRSNVYNAFHYGYGDLGLFGQSAGLLVDDGGRLRMVQLLCGRYWLARDDEGRATTIYRQLRWSVERIVKRFGLDRVSDRIRTAWDTANYDQMHDIWHAVEPRVQRDPRKIDKRNKPFMSNYWEDQGGGDGKMLEESGFDENPIIAPPWMICGDDNYAQSPGMDVLADVKMLQAEQKDKMEAIAKMVRPPLQGPSSLTTNPSSLLPGSLTTVDDPTGNGIRPVVEVNPRIAELLQDIKATKECINRGFYSDLFLMLANMEGIQPRNSFEIAERKEEKLLALGPVLENIYNAQLEPSIDRAFNIAVRARALPPPPREIAGDALSIEYISVLAQAQKAVATGSIERLSGYAGQLAAVRPDVLDKIDFDQSIDLYADAVGAPASMVVPDDKVAKIRAGRAQQQQAAQNVAMAKEAAPAITAGADAAQVLADAQNNPGGQALLSKLGLA
ncbi:MAG: phage tail protein [Methylacidiphilales bacterium]|nr:phage tail protein [Candidatus Methylacidiphilales bacterium]